MSLNPSNITGMDLPLKIFVKEGNCCEEETPTKKVNNELGFKGLEAKIAYDEAISQDFRSQNTDQKHQAGKEVVKRGNGRKLRASTTKQSSDRNVTVNSVFKAIEQKDMEFLKTNLHAGNVNLTDGFGWTPLMSAAFVGNLDIVDFLLKLGAKRQIRDKSGLTAELLAAKNKFTNLAELLGRRVENNGRLHNSDESPTKNCSENTSSSERKNFYCSVCDAEYKDTTIMEHESSIVHIFNTKPKVPQAHYIVPKGSKGYQMLINSGWNEEHGLGPSGEGRKYPVKTTLKQDRKGLGLEKRSTAKVTHFEPGDYKAVKTRRLPNEKTLKRWERESHLKKEARREKALRKALS